MHLYSGLNCTDGGCGIFGLSGPVNVYAEDWWHLNRSAGGYCSSLEACATPLRDVMKMEHTIVMSVVSGL